MHTALTLTAAFAITLAIAAPACSTPPTSPPAATVPSASSAATKTARVTLQSAYRNVDGQSISQAAFAKAIGSGRHFSMRISSDHKTATLTLLPVGSTANAGLMSAPPLPLGKPLPDFHLATLDGGHMDRAQLAGKPTLVDLFFADCVGCIEELPAMNAWMEQHPEMNYLAITFDDADTARTFVKQRHFRWPVAWGAGDYLNKTLQTKVYPTLFLLDASGRLLAARTGSIPVQTTTPPNAADGPAQAASTASTTTIVETIHETSPTAEASPAQQAQTRKAQLQWLDGWVHAHLPHHGT